MRQLVAAMQISVDGFIQGPNGELDWVRIGAKTLTYSPRSILASWVAACIPVVGKDTDVTVWHDFDSLESAQGFARSDRLHEVMAGAGVASEPQIWFTNPT